MSGTRIGNLPRVVALGLLPGPDALAAGGAGRPGAGKDNVVQCGWNVGTDTGWADNTGGAKFRPDDG